MRSRKKNAETFDDEGFMKTGDAVCFADPDRLESGLQFDGRIGEDFKLLSAVWVQSARLRLGAMPALAGLAQDIVITGENRTDLGLLVFPDPQPGSHRPGLSATCTSPIHGRQASAWRNTSPSPICV